MSEVRTPQHNISIVVDGVQVRDWMTYEIRTDMLQPTDTFTLRIPFVAGLTSALPAGRAGLLNNWATPARRGTPAGRVQGRKCK